MNNNKKLKKTISEHKKITFLIAEGIIKKDDIKSLGFHHITGEEICLILSDFKCEHCGSEDNLTIHHLIYKHNKKYCPTNKYYSQRFYFFNLVVLCINCHKKLHHEKRDGGFISSKKIIQIKKEYGIKDDKK